jgi:alpha-N-arabinofuranosidase
MMLAFDEWNVWYHHREHDKLFMREHPWQSAPPIAEESYTLADAPVVGSMLIALLRNADRVRIACLAQLVNALAPIMTETGGAVWRQTIFYPYLHASQHGRGIALDARVASPVYANEMFDAVPVLDATATLDEESGVITIFAVNRSEEVPLHLRCAPRAFGDCRIAEHLTLAHADSGAANTVDSPRRVIPRRVEGSSIESVILPPLSWNVIRLEAVGRHDGGGR